MSAQLKIICFLFDPNIGGPTIRARSVYEQMATQGYDIRIAFPEGAGTAAGYLAEKGLPVDQLAISKPVMPRKIGAFLKFALGSPLALFRVVRYLRREKPDVIHVNGAFDTIPAIAGRLAGVPVVWHLNDTVFGPGLSRILGRLVRLVASEIVIAATRVGEHYGVMGAAPRVIFAPVDVHRFKARDTDRIPDAQPKLTLVGNWNWIKGHDRFIAVLLDLKQQGIPARGIAAGGFLDGQRNYWEPLLDRIKSKGLADSFDAPGFVSDTVGLLTNSDLLLLTSHSEASPMSLLEAMSIGLPVVSFDVGGAKEMLGQKDDAAGIVVPNGDIRAMSHAVATLLGDTGLYQKMARNGQRRARDKFSLETCIERHMAAYEAAVQSKGRIVK